MFEIGSENMQAPCCQGSNIDNGIESVHGYAAEGEVYPLRNIRL